MLHYETPRPAHGQSGILGQRCTTCARAHAMVILFNAEERVWLLGLPARAAGWRVEGGDGHARGTNARDCHPHWIGPARLCWMGYASHQCGRAYSMPSLTCAIARSTRSIARSRCPPLLASARSSEARACWRCSRAACMYG